MSYLVFQCLLQCEVKRIITGRNEVVAKVMFLLVSVILSTRWGSVSVHAGIPPPAKETPPAKEIPLLRRPPRRPPCQGDPPTKETPHQGDPPCQGDPSAKEPPCQGAPCQGDPPPRRPLPRRPPLQRRPPAKETPSGKQTPAYGQRAAGTHPTGMHSCFD